MSENGAVPVRDGQASQCQAANGQGLATWYCAGGGQQTGPVTAEVLATWAAGGHINSETPVWRQGLAAWAPLRQHGELVEEFRRRGIVLPPPPPGQPSQALGDNAGMRMLLPVGRSIPAIVAGYLGLLSIIPGFGVLAIGFAIWALVDMRRNPKRHGMGRTITGLVGGGIGTIFWAWFLVMTVSGH